MAGSGEAQDNPVAINVIPMVDVIFCLCVFFMCSFEFKQIEGAFASWLPRDRGAEAALPTEPKELRVALYWDERTSTVRRQFGLRDVADDAELSALLRGARDDWSTAGERRIPLVIDGDERLPWSSVLAVVNLAKGLAIGDVQFALGRRDV